MNNDLIDKLKLIEHYYGTYCSIKLTRESEYKLFEFLKSLVGEKSHLLNSPDSYHITLIYTQSPQPHLKSLSGDYNEEYDSFKFSTLGEKDNEVSVLEIFSPKLNDFEESLVSKYGISKTYPKYRPHITFAENIDLEGPITLPFTIKTKEIVVEPLKKWT